MYKKSLIDILEPIVSSMVFPIRINKVTNSGNEYTLYVCNVYHAQVGFTVNINGHDYTIVSVDSVYNRIVVNGTNSISAGITFNLYEPFFFYGTPLETNAEIIQERDSFNKTPMIWLMEGYSERFYDDNEDTMERESDIRLFFLTQSDHSVVSKSLNEDYVEPMNRLVQNFIKTYGDNYDIFDKWDFDHKPIRHTKFGVYINNKGYSKGLFADNLSGIELQVTLKILKTNDCGCTNDVSYISDEEIIPIPFITEDNQLIITE